MNNLRHELRTRLNQILGYSELLIEEAGERSPAELVADLEKLRAAGQQMLALLEDEARWALGAGRWVGTKTDLALPSPPSAQRPAPSAGAKRPGRLLVVDDDAANREMLVRQLERDGHTLVPAESGPAALALLEREPFDLVLLDFMMPDMDGCQVLERIRADERLRPLPVLMISALDELEQVVRSIELGADDYLTRPFEPVLLRARIQACLERKRLFDALQENYERLRELERLRDELTKMIVHDLRSPLASFLTGLQTLSVLGGLGAKQQDVLTIALRGGRMLLGMINDLLDVSKMEAGAMALDIEPIAPAELLREASEQMTPLLEQKRLSLVQELPPEIPTLPGDREKLVRTVVNLLANAIRFTPEGGTITLSVAPDEGNGSLRWAVRDTGEGIPAAATTRIFEKFGQVEGRQGRQRFSTGLGLTFCKMVVEAHGGRIWVESELGQGSTFFFALPLDR
jgi:signal transduction histidine kinase